MFLMKEKMTLIGIFSLPVPMAGFKHLIIGFRVKCSTTVLTPPANTSFNCARRIFCGTNNLNLTSIFSLLVPAALFKPLIVRLRVKYFTAVITRLANTSLNCVKKNFLRNKSFESYKCFLSPSASSWDQTLDHKMKSQMFYRFANSTGQH